MMNEAPGRDRVAAYDTGRGGPAGAGTHAVVILPTYNERPNVERIIPQILEYAEIDVLVVDDASPDGTAQAVREMAAFWPERIHLLERAGKLGLGAAYIAGFRWALARRYTHIIEMDADFSHHPATLPRLLQASRTADLVIGSRYVPGGRTVDWSGARKLISRAGSAYARTILGLPIHDLTGGFKCFQRATLEAIDLDSVVSTGYAFQIELTWRASQLGFRIAEIPITFADRQFGASKMNVGIVAEALVRVWQLRLSRPAASRPALPQLPLAPEPVFARRTRERG
jgi:dolichol-phosphate mannosyltransferase